MITYGMTYKQMYDHLCEDSSKLKYKMEYYLPKVIKEFRRTIRFPAWKWYEYESPKTKNNYVIIYYAENQNCIETPKSDFFVNVFFDKQRYVVRWRVSGYKHTTESPIILLRQIHAYSSHFLHRYKERYLKDKTLTSNDIACQYLSRNDVAMPIEITKEINRNIEQYGEGGKNGFRVRDGICFAQTSFQGKQSDDGDRNKDRIDAMAIIYTTFMSEHNMTDSQLIAIEKVQWEKWTQAYFDFMKESTGDNLTIMLEP